MSAQTNPLVGHGGRARRRKLTGQVMEALATAAAVLAAVVLAIVLVTLTKRALHDDFGKAGNPELPRAQDSGH